MQPKAILKFRLSSPHIGDCIRARVETTIALSLIEDNLNQRLYDADKAGLKLSVSNSSDAITINVSGYNDKLSILLEAFLQNLKSPKLDEGRFRLILDEVGPSSLAEVKEGH